MKRPDHGVVARAGQRVESFLMIDRVCRRLHVENPNVPVVTIHDSLLVPENHAEMVRAVIEQEFQKVLRIKPMVRFKEFSAA